MRPATTWRLAPAATAWLGVGVVLAITGLLTRRPDITAIGVPFLLGFARAVSVRPERRSAIRLTGPDQPVRSGGMTADVAIEPAPGTGVIALRVDAPGHRATEVLVAARARVIEVSMASVRTGRRELFRLDHREAGPDQLLTTSPVRASAVRMTVLPRTQSLGGLPLPFRLQGLTGPYVSRRVGDGGELSDVGPFRPGDRLRRVDWRVTARLNHGRPTAQPEAGSGRRPSRITELYVRRTLATADATVMLVIDSRDDVGPRIATWGDATRLRESEATSLDIARTAAASLAAGYLAAGNRVGLEDLGRLRRPVPPAGGRHQQLRLVQRLALSVPEGEPVPRERIPRLTSGALIVVLSTFLDDDAGRMAMTWRQAGHRVLAVDTLPRLVLTGASDRLETAYRIVAMERVDRIRALRRSAVDVVAWPLGGEPDPAHELELLARLRPRR